MTDVKRFIIMRAVFCVCALAAMVLICLFDCFIIRGIGDNVGWLIVIGLFILCPGFAAFDFLLYFFAIDLVRLTVALHSVKRHEKKYIEKFYTKRLRHILCIVLTVFDFALFILALTFLTDFDETRTVAAFMFTVTFCLTLALFIVYLHRVKAYDKPEIFSEISGESK